MPEREQKTKSFIMRILPYMIGSLLVYILIIFISNDYSFGSISDIMISLGLLGGLILLYAIGYFIVIIYEKFEKRKKM
jgi:hypothetical protein